MKVSEIMSPKPVCCWPSSSVLTAALVMRESDIGIVAVTKDPFTPVLVGVITDRDLCLRVVASGRSPSSAWVGGCMTEDPVCCTEHDDVWFAVDLMKRNQVRRLPVVNDKHELVGMVSFGDVVRKAGLETTAIVGALRTIYEPTHKPKPQVKGVISAA